MNGIVAYMKNAYQELMYKVTWPSWSDLQSSAILVLTASVIIAIFIWFMDFGSKNLMMEVYKLIVNG
jgi:preprotein translocase subunit SecE